MPAELLAAFEDFQSNAIIPGRHAAFTRLLKWIDSYMDKGYLIVINCRSGKFRCVAV